MLSRGIIIGKIVDDIASLKYRIQTRNRLTLFDLTKVCEDFFREVLNILYSYSLVNLNGERTNEPGLDLGDSINKVSYQVTSTKTSAKIIATLEKITDFQLKLYTIRKVLIVGEKQSSYSVDPLLLEKTSFNLQTDIVDLDDLLKEMVVADIEKLDSLFNLFKREFKKVEIEFEHVDVEGNFPSSLYNGLELMPAKKPLNAKKIANRFESDGFDESTMNLATIQDLYKALSKLPRITREIIPIIVERGRKMRFNYSVEEYGILPKTLQNFLRMSKNELKSEIAILMDAGIVYLGDGDIGNDLHQFFTLFGLTINEIIDWAIDEGVSLRMMFNTMDWTILDE